MTHESAVETEVFREHMAIIEFLACSLDEGGMPCEPGRLSLTTNGAAWTAELLDVARARYFVVVALTLDGLLALVNAMLKSRAAPWRSTTRRR